jgi:hypothetical protein
MVARGRRCLDGGWARVHPCGAEVTSRRLLDLRAVRHRLAGFGLDGVQRGLPLFGFAAATLT